MLRALLIAIQFLTRIPVPRFSVLTGEDVSRSLLFYPLVGVLLGVIIMFAASWFEPLWLSAAVVLVVWIGLTGALHLDGLADTADAWVGGHGDTQRTLEIMKDPYCGPMGVVAVVALLLVKFAALLELLRTSFPEALVLVPVLGRSGVLFFALTLPSARADGLAAELVTTLHRRELTIVLLISLFLCGWFSNWVLISFVVVLWIILARALLRRIGGLTGDLLGATIEITEAVSLSLLVILLNN